MYIAKGSSAHNKARDNFGRGEDSTKDSGYNPRILVHGEGAVAQGSTPIEVPASTIAGKLSDATGWSEG